MTTFNQFKVRFLVAALARRNFNYLNTARKLGIARGTLFNLVGDKDAAKQKAKEFGFIE